MHSASLGTVFSHGTLILRTVVHPLTHHLAINAKLLCSRPVTTAVVLHPVNHSQFELYGITFVDLFGSHFVARAHFPLASGAHGHLSVERQAAKS